MHDGLWLGHYNIFIHLFFSHPDGLLQCFSLFFCCVTKRKLSVTFSSIRVAHGRLSDRNCESVLVSPNMSLGIKEALFTVTFCISIVCQWLMPNSHRTSTIRGPCSNFYRIGWDKQSHRSSAAAYFFNFISLHVKLEVDKFLEFCPKYIIHNIIHCSCNNYNRKKREEMII